MLISALLTKKRVFYGKILKFRIRFSVYVRILKPNKNANQKLNANKKEKKGEERRSLDIQLYTTNGYIQSQTIDCSMYNAFRT